MRLRFNESQPVMAAVCGLRLAIEAEFICEQRTTVMDDVGMGGHRLEWQCWSDANVC